MLLDNKKKKLFDEAYQAYLKITKQIEDVYSEGIADPFAAGPSVTDLMCSLDQYLQGCLLKIGVSDGTLSEEELYFLTALPDEFDEVCARNRGYRRFIRQMTVERFQTDGPQFYDFEKTPMFLEVLSQDFDDAPQMVRSNMEIIFQAFIAVDGAFSKCESNAAIEILDKIDRSEKEEAPEAGLANQAGICPDGDEMAEALEELEDLVGLSEVRARLCLASTSSGSIICGERRGFRCFRPLTTWYLQGILGLERRQWPALWLRFLKVWASSQKGSL